MYCVFTSPFTKQTLGFTQASSKYTAVEQQWHYFTAEVLLGYEVNFKAYAISC
jgi:hypothetical protein